MNRVGGAWLLIAALLLFEAPTLRAGVVVFHDVRVIDGRGGVPLEHADVLIDGGTITRVSTDKSPTPSGALVVSLSGKTLFPGLISDHSHLGMVDGASSSGRNATRANIQRQLRQYEAYGVTTVMSLGLNLDTFYQVQRDMQQGLVPGADLVGADRGFGAPGGGPPADMGILDTQVYRPSSAEEARAEVRQSAARHPALLKLWLDDFHGKMPVKIAPDVYAAIIDEAHKNHLRVAAHVFYLEDARQLVNDGVDVLAHGVRDQPVDAAFIAALKSHGVWYIPTLGLDEAFYLFAEHSELTMTPVAQHALQAGLAKELEDPAWRSSVLSDTKGIAADKGALRANLLNTKTLFDAGVRMGFGTDSGATPLRVAGFAEHRELKLLVDAGLTPVQAISLATKNAAALLGLDDRGVIAPGKLADLVIVAGNPSLDISAVDNIVEVWHRGVRVAGPIDTFAP